MRACSPAFDLVPFADAVRRSCVTLRSPCGSLFAVLGNPLDAAAQDFLEERIPGAFAYRIAQPEELTAYFAEQESHVQAMDGLAQEALTGAARRDDAEEITLEAIDGADSRVIKLVTSTLYDALKS